MSSPSLRAALEVMLFSIGDCMLDAPEATQSFYRLEVPQWSGKLDYALEQLSLSVTVSSDDDDERDAASLLVAAG
jgi:hypothetical protein